MQNPTLPPPSAKVQQRVQLPADLDHQTQLDAADCGLSQPTFLGLCIRHGRALARAAVLGPPTADALVTTLKLCRGRKAGAR